MNKAETENEKDFINNEIADSIENLRTLFPWEEDEILNEALEEQWEALADIIRENALEVCIQAASSLEINEPDIQYDGIDPDCGPAKMHIGRNSVGNLFLRYYVVNNSIPACIRISGIRNIKITKLKPITPHTQDA